MADLAGLRTVSHRAFLARIGVLGVAVGSEALAVPELPDGPNPTLTTQALATRTAERISQSYFGGDPWVGTEAPVVSTDHRISNRLAQLGL